MRARALAVTLSVIASFGGIVGCSGGSGKANPVPVPPNTAPVAVAGPSQIVQPGDTVTLDGSSSGDPDGDAITYAWTLVARPYGSVARLVDATQARPTFVADVAGAYVALLVVNDGTVASAPATTVVQAGGPPAGCPGTLPTADAGPDQTVQRGANVSLSGAGSTSGGNAPLTYHWSLVSAPGQGAMWLTATTGASTSLWANATGVYVVSLVVNDGCADSMPAIVKITVPDEAPSASGFSATIPYNAPFTLQGYGWSTGSSPLSYQWTLVSSPTGSSAALSSTTTQQPTFTPDLVGQYVFSLVVSDGTLSSVPATVTLTAVEQGPVVSAGTDSSAWVGGTVTLDGSKSSDPNRTPLTYAWTLTTPASSTAVLSAASTASPSFVADVAGVYVATLVVSDGEQSASAKVSVSVWPAVTRLKERVLDAGYSTALDRIVYVSSGPAALCVLDPRTGAKTTVPLTLAPTSVSVSPNGLFAAVGHANAVSYVDLTSAAVTRVAVNGDVTEVALADDGYVYAASRRADNHIQIFAVSTATGAESDALSNATGQPSARIRPGAPALYLEGDGGSPIQGYDISGDKPVLTSLSSLSYSGCTGLWVTAAGDRLITGCGTVLRASSSPVDDLTPIGTLPGFLYGSPRLTHASDSTVAGEISCIASGTYVGSWRTDTTLRRYASDGLALEETALFPLENLSGSMYPWYGRFVFYRSDGSERYVLMQLDPAAAAVQDYGIATY